MLNKIPKALQAKAKSNVHQIWLAETREMATNLIESTFSTIRPAAIV